MTGSLQIKKLKSGKSYYYIRLSYKDARTGQWKTKTLATKLEAKNNKKKAESMITRYIDQYSYLEELPDGGSVFVNPDITLNEYMEIWLRDKKRDLKLSTYEGYAFRVNCIGRYFDDKRTKVTDVTPKMIDTFFKYCLRYGKTNQKTKEREPLSVRSVRSYKSILFAVFNQAVIDGLIRFNPVSGISVHGKQNKDYDEDLLFLTEDEIAGMLAFLATEYPRLLGIAFMGAYYGLRRSEILGLKWEAIDAAKKTIRINHTLVRVKTESAEDSTKTQSGRRELNLFPTAEKCLEKIWCEQQENKKFYGTAYKNKDGYVFTWEDGTLYNPDYISKLFTKAMIRFGRPEISLHKLRHSCASMLINRGWDIKKLQYWLGHSDAQTTLNIYSHFNRRRLNSSENDLSEISLASADLF